MQALHRASLSCVRARGPDKKGHAEANVLQLAMDFIGPRPNHRGLLHLGPVTDRAHARPEIDMSLLPFVTYDGRSGMPDNL